MIYYSPTLISAQPAHFGLKFEPVGGLFQQTKGVKFTFYSLPSEDLIGEDEKVFWEINEE
jgi:hypothetical protein